MNESGVSPFIKKEVFDNAVDFQNYMLETCGENSPVVLLKDEYGVVICGYHYDLRLIYRGETEKGDIVVVTDRAYYDGRDVYDTLLSGAYILLIADLVVCAIV